MTRVGYRQPSESVCPHPARGAPMQRLLPVAASSRTHADRHQAVAGPDRECAHGGQLCEVQRSFAPVAAAKDDPMTALPGHEQVLTTQTGRSSFSRAARRSDRLLAGQASTKQSFMGTRPRTEVHRRPLSKRLTSRSPEHCSGEYHVYPRQGL